LEFTEAAFSRQPSAEAGKSSKNKTAMSSGFCNLAALNAVNCSLFPEWRPSASAVREKPEK
jgi:hypothetical protein